MKQTSTTHIIYTQSQLTSTIKQTQGTNKHTCTHTQAIHSDTQLTHTQITDPNTHTHSKDDAGLGCEKHLLPHGPSNAGVLAY